jgi:hypothetical protein
MHCRAQAASVASALAASAGVLPPPWVGRAVRGHAQFHVEGQSVSTAQGPVGWATHVLQVIDVHVLASVGFRLTPGGTTPGGGRRFAQGTLVAIAYDGTFALDGGASWP